MNYPVIAALAILSLAFGSAARADTFKISGGKTIEHPTKRGQPLPANASGIKMEFCGPLVGPSKTEADTAVLIWAFSIAVPKDEQFSSITIEDVSAEVAQPVFSGDISALEVIEFPEDRVVQVQGAPTAVGSDSASWLYEKGKTVRVFRIVLDNQDGEQVTLYQPSIFSADQKKKLQAVAKRAAASEG
jgi:hypothetical protein